MNPNLEETLYIDFITSSPTTGAAADADSTPTAEVFEDNTDTTVYALTVTKRTGKTGNYRVAVACTTANGFELGKSYNVIASATVGGVAAKAVIGSFQIRPGQVVLRGTAQSGVGSYSAHKGITLAAAVSAPENYFKGNLITIVAGTGAGQSRCVLWYHDATKEIEVARLWFTDPDNTSVYAIIRADLSNLTDALEVVVGSITDKAGYSLTAGEHSSIGGDVQTGLTAQGYTTARAAFLDTLNGIVASIWGALTSGMVSAGSIGAKLATWALGSDFKALLSADPQNPVTLPTTPPAGYGGGGGGGGATAAEVAAAILVDPTHKLATDAAGTVTAAPVSLRSDAFGSVTIDGLNYLNVMKYIAAAAGGKISYDPGTFLGSVASIADPTQTRIQFTSDENMLSRKDIILTP